MSDLVDGFRVVSYRNAAILATAIVSSAWGSANGGILIDNFTQTSDPGLYPAVEEAKFPAVTQFLGDPFGTIDGVDAARVMAFNPALSPGQAIGGAFDGEQTIELDTSAGTLTSRSTGDGRPLFLLAYTPQTPSVRFDLDVSGESGLRLRYNTSQDVSVGISLFNAGDDDPNDFVAGNQIQVLLQADEQELFIPLSDISTALTEVDLSSSDLPIITLPDLDPTSLDSISLDN